LSFETIRFARSVVGEKEDRRREEGVRGFGADLICSASKSIKSGEGKCRNATPFSPFVTAGFAYVEVEEGRGKREWGQKEGQGYLDEEEERERTCPEPQRERG
jgi:hypothetical protein